MSSSVHQIRLVVFGVELNHDLGRLGLVRRKPRRALVRPARQINLTNNTAATTGSWTTLMIVSPGTRHDRPQRSDESTF